MSKIFVIIQRSISKIKTSTLLSICFIWISTFIITLGNVGAKWKGYQFLLIYLLMGFSGLIILFRREIDVYLFQVKGRLAIRIGIYLTTFSLLGAAVCYWFYLR